MCEFTRQVSGPPFDAIVRARPSIEASGGSLSGDARSGTIKVPTPVGDIVGEYVISGDAIAFRITDKPFFVPCAAIEARVDRFLFG
jgi:hypothetical protein